MRLSALVCAAAAAALVLPAAASAQQEPFTYDDLLNVNRLSDPQVSPDGDQVVYSLRTTPLAGGSSSLYILDLDGEAEPRRLAISDEGANTARWSADGQLFFLSNRSGSSQVWRTDEAGDVAVQVTDLPVDVQTYQLSPAADRIAVAAAVFPDCPDLACTAARLDEEPDNSGTLYTQLFVRHWDQWSDGTRNHVFVLDLSGQGVADGEPIWATRDFDGDTPSRPFGDESAFTFTPDGNGVVFAAREAGTSEPWSTDFDIYLQPIEAEGLGERVNLTDSNPAWDDGPVFSPDGRTMAYRAMSRPGFEADQWKIMLRDVATGQVRQIAANWDRSPDSLQWSANGNSLYATAYDTGQVKLFEIDVISGSVIPITGEGHVAAVEQTPSGFILAMDSLTSPVALYRKTFRGREMPIRITDHNPQLDDLAFGEPEQFTFEGWNNETVHGYVIKPANYVEGGTYPVAFLIHGGPQGSFGNSWSYRWNPSTYTGAGYAVVMIDFHGSIGYGQEFTDAISGHWGDRPLEDLQKGWDYALDTYDFLDGGRACALGASYGGYMINWIAGNWPDAFQCMVNHDGVFDTRFMGYSTEELWFTEWENRGSPWERGTTYEEFNPVNHVQNWNTPMMVIQGGRDYRVPTDQSIAAFTALQRRGIESQLLYFPDENHWVLQPRNSLRWHTEVFDWLDRHIGDDAE